MLAAESREAKRLREEQEKREAEHNELKKKVFKEHKISSARSRLSSRKALEETKQMGESIKESRRLSVRFDEAKENFDMKCKEVIQRCIEEEKHAEAVE